MVFLFSQYQHEWFGLVCRHCSGWVSYATEWHRHRKLIQFPASQLSDIMDCLYAGRRTLGYTIVEDNLGMGQERGKGVDQETRRVRKKKRRECDGEIVVLHKISDILQYLSVLVIKITSDSGDRKQSKITMEITSTSSSVFPCWVPLGFLGSILFCWVPFSDYGVNKHYINLILRMIQDSHSVDILGKNECEGAEIIPVLLRTGSSMFFFVYIVIPLIVIMSLILGADTS